MNESSPSFPFMFIPPHSNSRIRALGPSCHTLCCLVSRFFERERPHIICVVTQLSNHTHNESKIQCCSPCAWGPYHTPFVCTGLSLSHCWCYKDIYVFVECFHFDFYFTWCWWSININFWFVILSFLVSVLLNIYHPNVVDDVVDGDRWNFLWLCEQKYLSWVMDEFIYWPNPYILL